MFRLIRFLLLLLPSALLAAVIAFWIASQFSNPRLLIWYGRQFVFVAPSPQACRLIFNRDADAFPLQSRSLYFSGWNQSDRFEDFDSFLLVGTAPSRTANATFYHLAIEEPGSRVSALHLGQFYLNAGGLASSPFVQPLSQHLIVDMPYWPLALILTAIAAVQIRASVRRHRFGIGKPGHCVTCGYDLRASSARCPECGAPITKPTFKRRDPVRRRRWRRVDLGIRRHAVAILLLAPFTVLAVYNALGANSIRETPIDEHDVRIPFLNLPAPPSPNERFMVAYNVMDQPDLWATRQLDPAFEKRLHRDGDGSDTVRASAKGTVLYADLTRGQHRMLIDILNERRSAK